jgi:hypothetical protein
MEPSHQTAKNLSFWGPEAFCQGGFGHLEIAFDRPQQVKDTLR